MKIHDRTFPRISSVFGTLGSIALAAALVTGCGGGGSGSADISGATGEEQSSQVVSGARTLWLSWRAPAERESGEALPLSELSGYRVYWGTADDPQANEIDITDPSITTYQITDIEPGTYQVAVTAIDRTGLESSQSNAITKSLN
jgi:hypothetical protein